MDVFWKEIRTVKACLQGRNNTCKIILSNQEYDLMNDKQLP